MRRRRATGDDSAAGTLWETNTAGQCEAKLKALPKFREELDGLDII